MDLVVDRQHLERLVDQDFAEILEESDRRLAHMLAHEIVAYGADVLPRELFLGNSGRRIAAVATRDVEGVCRLDLGERLPNGGRIAAVSAGLGFAPLVLAARRSDLTVDVVESDEGRAWLFQRMCRVFGVRNLRLHSLDAGAWTESAMGTVELMLAQGPSALAAVEEALPWLSCSGSAAIWLPDSDIAPLRRPIPDGRGGRVRLDEVEPFACGAARPGGLLRASCETAEPGA